MSNPICSTLFDSRDLKEYREELESELVDSWNLFFEERFEPIDEEDEDEEYEEVDSFEDIDLEEEEFRTMHEEEISEYEDLKSFMDELEGYGDWDYGETIIHEDYFEQYTKDFASDIGAVGENSSWIEIDWEATADNLKQDYMTATYQGEDYYMRS